MVSEICRELKSVGNYAIMKVTEVGHEVYYDIYDNKDDDYVTTFRDLREARKWCKIMSK